MYQIMFQIKYQISFQIMYQILFQMMYQISFAPDFRWHTRYRFRWLVQVLFAREESTGNWKEEERRWIERKMLAPLINPARTSVTSYNYHGSIPCYNYSPRNLISDTSASNIFLPRRKHTDLIQNQIFQRRMEKITRSIKICLLCLAFQRWSFMEWVRYKELRKSLEFEGRDK